MRWVGEVLLVAVLERLEEQLRVGDGVTLFFVVLVDFLLRYALLRIVSVNSVAPGLVLVLYVSVKLVHKEGDKL